MGGVAAFRENAADHSFYLRNAYSKRQFAKKAIEI
jgi:hypothetical protein